MSQIEPLQSYQGLFDSVQKFSPQVPADSGMNSHMASVNNNNASLNVPAFSMHQSSQLPVSQVANTSGQGHSLALNNAMKLMMQSKINSLGLENA